jgi:hypothetical protein
MLRRTKQHIIDKSYQKIDVVLTCEERLVYRKMMSFSQKIFATYSLQQLDKTDTYDKILLRRNSSSARDITRFSRCCCDCVRRAAIRD